MRKLLSAVTGIVLWHSPVFYERKRLKLSKRLHWIFDRDFIEGTLECAVRSHLARS
ncbi:MAG: hypothetical protein IJQ08_09085 [Synergistaceae bacterium]|nr:hypothetical protein [Synergistaceae bacterium]